MGSGGLAEGLAETATLDLLTKIGGQASRIAGSFQGCTILVVVKLYTWHYINSNKICLDPLMGIMGAQRKALDQIRSNLFIQLKKLFSIHSIIYMTWNKPIYIYHYVYTDSIKKHKDKSQRLAHLWSLGSKGCLIKGLTSIPFHVANIESQTAGFLQLRPTILLQENWVVTNEHDLC